MSKRIFLTGITGFLGSRIGQKLVESGFIIAGAIRSSSNISGCNSYSQSINWIYVDKSGWQEELINFNPEYIIHCSWEGVGARQRDDWSVQLSNLNFLSNLLVVVRNCDVVRFIALGSQAEYGNFNGEIDESSIPRPETAYGSVKIICQQLIHSFSEKNNINWLWLRLFSFFGEGESSEWFIPSITQKLLNGEVVEMTKGEQVYSYMYVEDLADLVVKIIKTECESGIYNICSKNAISLRELVSTILGYLNIPIERVKFGAIPYRVNQPMYIIGSTKKIKGYLGEILETNFEENLKRIIEFHKGNINNDKL
jgi:nucleoside-diphosphate-sugar epimerase